MAITLNSLNPAKYGFVANGYSADMSGTEELKSAPGAGIQLVLTHLTVNVGANLDITVGSGEAGGSVESVILGPLSMLAGATLSWNFGNGGILLPANKSLTLDASGAGGVTAFVVGYQI